MSSDDSWLFPVRVMLGCMNHRGVQSCSISSVSNALRDSREEAYNPKLIAIGLLHRGGGSTATTQLQLMEDSKWHYMKYFLNQQQAAGGNQPQNSSTTNQPQNSITTTDARLINCGKELLKIDNVTRASYGGNIELEPKELAIIMMLDGCFLLELLIRLGNYIEGANTNNHSEDPIFMSREKLLLVINDITMLENQIPFIVLKKIYRKVFPDGTTEVEDDHRVANIVCKAFGYPLKNSSGAVHILHYMHMSTVEQQQHREGKQAKVELVCCATRLLANGISFQSNTPSQKDHPNLVDTFTFDISFESGELVIPTLYVRKTTEVKWRNLIAWEQSRTGIRCKYTSYALFFKGLICCKHDIKLLVDNRIIVNETLSSNDDLLRLFKTISKGVEHMDSSYTEICNKLNVYRSKRVTRMLQQFPIIAWHRWIGFIEMVVYVWQNWYRILIQDHIPNVWKLVGVLAATALLVLTIMQTIYASKSQK